MVGTQPGLWFHAAPLIGVSTLPSKYGSIAGESLAGVTVKWPNVSPQLLGRDHHPGSLLGPKILKCLRRVSCKRLLGATNWEPDPSSGFQTVESRLCFFYEIPEWSRGRFAQGPHN